MKKDTDVGKTKDIDLGKVKDADTWRKKIEEECNSQDDNWG